MSSTLRQKSGLSGKKIIFDPVIKESMITCMDKAAKLKLNMQLDCYNSLILGLLPSLLLMCV